MNHEFQHHRPQAEWRCSGSCAKVYRQRDDFVRHILGDHLEWTVSASSIDSIVDRRKFKRRETDCPFCAKIIAEDKCSVQIHIGAHMDEIALKVLPQETETENDTASKDGISLKNTNKAIKSPKSRDSVLETAPPLSISPPPTPPVYEDTTNTPVASLNNQDVQQQYSHLTQDQFAEGIAQYLGGYHQQLNQNMRQDQNLPNAKRDQYTLAPVSTMPTNFSPYTTREKSHEWPYPAQDCDPFLLLTTPQSVMAEAMSERNGKSPSKSPQLLHRSRPKQHICPECQEAFPFDARLR